MNAIDLLKAVREPCGRQIIWSEPPAEIGERSSGRRKGDADQREPCQRARLCEARPPGLCRIEFVRHVPLQSTEKREGFRGYGLSSPDQQAMGRQTAALRRRAS